MSEPFDLAALGRLIAELEFTRAERDDLAEQLDLAFEMQREYLARAERAEAELAELRTFLDDDSDDWINEHNALKAAIARVEALIDTRMHIRDLEFERALRGDRA